MFLSNAALKKIHALIQNYHNAMVYNLLTKRGVLTNSEIKRLEVSGLVDKTLRMPLQDAYMFGKIKHLLGRGATRKMTLQQFLQYAATNPHPLSNIEQEAIAHASQRAGKYIQDLGHKTSSKVTQVVNDLTADYMQKLLRKEVPKAIAARETGRALASRLHTVIGGSIRDFEKIAYTEMQNAMQMGVAQEILKRDKDARVVRLPRPDACQWCLKLHLDKKGNPIVFKLSSLMRKSNIGKKKKDWTATADSIHPFCSCETVHIPNGWKWDNISQTLMPKSVMKARLNKSTNLIEYKQKGQPWDEGETTKEKELAVLGVALRGIRETEHVRKTVPEPDTPSSFEAKHGYHPNLGYGYKRKVKDEKE